MIWFTSDTHFGHKNIIKYCNRPFENVEEMDQTIIKNWNSVVKDNDLVYHLGDFMSWAGNSSTIERRYRQYRHALKGKIFLIEGNHDYKIGSPFSYALEGKCPLMTLRYQGRKIILCHYAMKVWDASHFDSWHLFGHSHGTLDAVGKSWDVGVDSNEFTPISFNDLGAIMNNQCHNENWVERLPGYKNVKSN
jgi:calcineurin-like phosphoesterase family protein